MQRKLNAWRKNLLKENIIYKFNSASLIREILGAIDRVLGGTDEGTGLKAEFESFHNII